jgi:hypothetical protein
MNDYSVVYGTHGNFLFFLVKFECVDVIMNGDKTEFNL